MSGLGAHYELAVVCQGETDPTTGYCLNIREIDRAARERAIPIIARAFVEQPDSEPTAILAQIVTALTADLPRLTRLGWRFSPTYSIEMERSDMTSVLMRQSFEFAAAHRLHSPSLSDEENRRVFGKCNNPAGHGHNYRIEPAVRVKMGSGNQSAFCLRDLERLTNDRIIDYLDHTHLNCDVPEFAEVNPSVENIAKVCYDRLAGAIQEADAELHCVTVWETEKTSCVYPVG
jgi:6-pyruvoyltetrahydropterin/6-carboxytetrahydropterin synthase